MKLRLKSMPKVTPENSETGWYLLIQTEQCIFMNKTEK